MGELGENNNQVIDIHKYPMNVVDFTSTILYWNNVINNWVAETRATAKYETRDANNNWNYGARTELCGTSNELYGVKGSVQDTALADNYIKVGKQNSCPTGDVWN
jgi:hypothetical protein